MRSSKENHQIDLKNMTVTDDFWRTEIDLVRKEVIPYQWEALNDRVKDAEPSFCMHNFKTAAKLGGKRREEGGKELQYTYRGFDVWPKDPENPGDEFYGFVFQDSDLYKWIEAVAYSLIQFPDAELEKTCDEAIEIVARAQAEDGYMDTYYILNGRDREFTNLKDHHELYCFGHLAEAAVAYYEATGKAVLLGVAERFAHYIASKIGREEGKKRGYPGHEIAEMALVRMYNATGSKEYLDLASYFVDERGTEPYYFDVENPKIQRRGFENSSLPFSYNQAHKPVRQQDEALGHAVRAVYLYSGMADVARITDDEELKNACDKLWKSITRDKMYITGGIGSSHLGESFTFPFDLPNDTAYTESCAAIGLAFFARRMLETAPKAEYGDVIERALYNGILSGIALDGKSFFYVNPLEVLPQACHEDGRKHHVKPIRQKWFGCACCPPNIARILSSVGAYAYTENDNTLFAHMTMGCEYKKNMNGNIVTIKADVDRSVQGKWTAMYTVSGAEGTDFTLAVRKPDWCKAPEFVLENGTMTEEDGYVYMTKNWGSEDVITVTLPMEVRFMTADTRVREDIGKVALTYGPEVFCLEEHDNGKDLQLVTVSRDVKKAEPEFGSITIDGISGVTVSVPGVRSMPNTASGLYFDLADETRETVKLTYIPYRMWANRGENEMQVWTRLD